MTYKWKDMYQKKLMSAEEAVKLIGSGDTIVAPLSNGQPVALPNALAKRAIEENLQNITYVAGVDVRWFDLYQPELKNHVLIDTGFLGPATRHWVGQGMFTYTPCRLGETVDMVVECRQVAVVTVVVSPMDKHGFFSTGCNVDWGWESAKRGEPRLIIVEVNENMPRTYGTNQLHISEVAAVVENHIPLFELPPIPVSKEDEAIGSFIDELIEDGSCIQIGIGGMPNAVANGLKTKKDLGIHSEMLTDTMVDLYNEGVITCAKKNFNPYKWIGSFALGTSKLYDFLDENPMVEMHSTKYVNDPNIIGLNDNMISVNATLEVDLSGQCASESLTSMQYSGTGGQLDFVQGAWRSRGGKSFLCLYSTYTNKEGEVKSKIVPSMTSGAFTTVSRTDTQYVVTEWGVAFMKGQNLRSRVKELIRISHPDFRDWLEFEARKLNYIP